MGRTAGSMDCRTKGCRSVLGRTKWAVGPTGVYAEKSKGGAEKGLAHQRRPFLGVQGHAPQEDFEI